MVWSILCVLLMFFSANDSYSQINDAEIYNYNNSTKILSQKFINALCKAARNQKNIDDPLAPSELEALIVMAAETGTDDSLKSKKVRNWHSKYGNSCQCPATKKYPAGDFLRQVVHSNNRSFANRVGPNNDLPMDLTLQSPADGLTIYEYINKERIRLEAKHHDLRYEFQKDQDWRDLMFFYFLFSEYGIN